MSHRNPPQGPQAWHSFEEEPSLGQGGIFNTGLFSLARDHRETPEKHGPSHGKSADVNPAMAEQFATKLYQGLAPKGQKALKLNKICSGRSPQRRRHVISKQPFRGHYRQAAALSGRPVDLAWDAMLRLAAPWQSTRPRKEHLSIVLQPEDLQRKIRAQREKRLFLFLVDTSGSMGGRLMCVAKKLALAVLHKAYVKRDQVAMIAFRGSSAALLFDATNQAQRVHKALSNLPCGGTTPLGLGLNQAVLTLARAKRRSLGDQHVLFLISDGRANIGSQPGLMAMLAEIEAACKALSAQPRLKIIFIDTTEEGKNDYPAKQLTEMLGAWRIQLSKVELSIDNPTALLGYFSEWL